MRAKDVLGRRGEDLAAKFLIGVGHEIIDRNWRCAYGEIDLISRDQHQIVFVEVKTRRSMSKGHPLEAITASKLARLRRLAGAWIAAHPQHPRRIRLDAIGVVDRPGRPAEVHYRRAIGG